MRALFDVNVLIALLDRDHVGHVTATAWYERELAHGWASCPLTENGVVRIMASAGYPNPLPVPALLARLEAARTRKHHRFWPDELSITDPGCFRHGRIRGPKQVTDGYLLALAVKRGGRLITFDRAIQPDAVIGASQRHLVRLE